MSGDEVLLSVEVPPVVDAVAGQVPAITNEIDLSCPSDVCTYLAIDLDDLAEHSSGNHPAGKVVRGG